MLERINGEGLAPPSGFSHAVVATGGRLVFLAGQTALDEEGRLIPGGVVDQFERALRNMLTALAAAGGGPEHLARVTIYATRPDDYRAHAREIGAVWRAHAGRDYPAMALVGVTRLWDTEALVEMDGIAILPPMTGK
jgi:enamine deaminase RidA (YjgF/YER057c/UK114 family)